MFQVVFGNRGQRVNTLERCIVEIRESISFVILTRISSVVSSKQPGDQVFLSKMYTKHICKHPWLIVKGLIKLCKSVY